MKLHALLFCCIALSGIAGPRYAKAQVPPPAAQLFQIVRLTDGSVYQGELVELVPGDHLTLRLATGEIRRIAWSAIQSFGTPDGSIDPSMAGHYSVLLPSIATPLPPPGAADLVQLHFQSDDAQTILISTRASGIVNFNRPGLYDDGVFSDWTMVCPRAPCDVRADRRLIYGIAGPGIVRSLPFGLPQANAATGDVRVGHQRTRNALKLLAGLGGMVAVGGLATITASRVHLEFSPMLHTAYIAGGIMLGSGVLLTIGGIVASACIRTTIDFRTDGRLALRLPGKAELDLSTQQIRF